MIKSNLIRMLSAGSLLAAPPLLWGQVTPIGPFQGPWTENFETFPNYWNDELPGSIDPQSSESLEVMGGLATLSTSGPALYIFEEGLAPHGILASATSIAGEAKASDGTKGLLAYSSGFTIAFEEPVYAFGGFFGAANGLQYDGLISFSSAGTDLESFFFAGTTLIWRGWEFADGVTSLTITGVNLAADGLQADPNPSVSEEPEIVWADPVAIPFGTPLGEDQLNATSNIPGTFTYNPGAGTVLPAGTWTLTTLFTPEDPGFQPTTLEVGIEVLPWPWSGFNSPVANLPVVNIAKAGSAVPLKFSLGGYRGMDIFGGHGPQSVPVPESPASTIEVAESAQTPGASGLSYDPLTDQYSYVWKTDRSWSKSSRRLILPMADGTTQEADFRFK